MSESKNTIEHKSGLSRRNFLKGSAIVAAGAAAIGIAGCTSEGGGTTDSSETGGDWDKSADLVVVGTGTAVVAALAASDFGAASVIALEKGSVLGGTSAMSGGGCGIPLTHIAEEEGVVDSMDEVLKYYNAATGGRCDLDVARSYVEHGDEYLRWAEEKTGFTWGFTLKMYQDYYEPCEGWLEFGRGNISVLAIDGEENSEIAAGIWKKYQAMIDADDKIELLLETAATRLVTDENGAVTGVVAEGADGEIRIGANKGVVLGTGGFEHNDAMRTQYLPFPLLAASSVPTNTGDGQRMGMAVGADLANMDRNWGLPHYLLSGASADDLIANNQISIEFTGMDPGMYRGIPGMVYVNKRGHRFGNESAAYPVLNRTFGFFDNYSCSLSNVPAYAIYDSSYVGTYRLPGQAAASDPVPDIFVQADTLEGLAELLGIDAAGLVAEIAEFNAQAKEGRDPKFNRGGHRFDINTAGVYAGNREDLPNTCLSALETGPFYGTVVVPGTFGTSGGLKIDPNSQVVGLTGEAIPGLFAVGNCSSGVTAGTYCSGGMTVGQGMVMSYVVAKHLFGA